MPSKSSKGIRSIFSAASAVCSFHSGIAAGWYSAPSVGVATPDILTQILSWNDQETEYYEVCPEDLYDGPENYIRLNREREVATGPRGNINAILDKMADGSGRLGTIANIDQGVVSGCDYISNRNIEKLPGNSEVTTGDGIFVFDYDNPRDKDVVSQFTERERAILKKFYKNSDIRHY